MGRHGLRQVPSALLWLAALAAATAQANMGAYPKSNISQTEYETKHRMYFDLVEQNQRTRLNESGDFEEDITRRRLHRFTHSGLENSRRLQEDVTSQHFKYEIYIPKEADSEVEVEEASLRMFLVPKSCATTGVRLSAVHNSRLLSTTTLKTQECLPRWTALDVTSGLRARDNKFAIVLECEGCITNQVDVLDPVLNVIVKSSKKFRRRRAVTEKRRKKCSRESLIIDFEKLKGYQFVEKPRQYDAGVCSGRCNRKDPSTQRSMLLYQLSRTGVKVPKPCCAPSKMGSLEILSIDEEDDSKLTLSIWNDSTILECTCL